MALMSLGVAVLAVGDVVGAVDRDAGLFSYLLTTIYLPLTLPLYLACVAVAGLRSAHPRRWAVALTPLLTAVFPHAFILIAMPGIATALLTFGIYGATISLPARRPPRLYPN